MKIIKYLLTLVFICFILTGYSQDNMLCQGYYWTEDEANIMMKKFAMKWDDINSWAKRAEIIKQGIIQGMKLEQMTIFNDEFNPVTKNTRIMDGYIVENIAIESFPGFYITTR